MDYGSRNTKIAPYYVPGSSQYQQKRRAQSRVYVAATRYRRLPRLPAYHALPSSLWFVQRRVFSHWRAAGSPYCGVTYATDTCTLRFRLFDLPGGMALLESAILDGLIEGVRFRAG